jgi:polyhydroxybutyrate depolymerase
MKRVTWAVLFLGMLGCSRSDLDAIGRPPGADGGGRDVADSGREVADSGREVADSGREVADTGTPDVADSGREVADTGTPDVPDSGGGNDADAPVQVCPSQILKAGETNQTVLVGTTARSYVLHVPNKYDGTKPVPLILDFHAQTGSGTSEAASSPYPAQTDGEGVIMAFPSGLAGPLGPSWNVGPCCVDGADDLGFARKVVAQVQTLACIDSKRVYAVGLAPGGGMAYLLACKAADVFAAVAPAEWDLLKENVAECTPSRPVTVVAFRGVQDNLVLYEGGPSTFVPSMPVTFLGAQATFKQWAQIDGCTGSPSDPDSNGCSTYSSCAPGVVVTLCSKPNGGMEPGNPAIAWPVLKQHPMP